MTTALDSVQLQRAEGALRKRADQLRIEVLETRERESEESFSRVAGEAPDAQDASLAHLVVDLNDAAVARDSEELRDIDQALGRIAAGSYGVCPRCGQAIEPARLKALPTAKYDIRCQRLEDQEHGSARTLKL